MHLLIKGFYGYKNLGDELILFQLLNRIEDRFSPKKISIECGDSKRLENWIIKHKSFLIPGIISKINFLPKPTLKEKIQICLGKKRGLYDLIIFGGGEVVDESRNLLYRGRNLYFQYKRSIKNGRTILIGGLGTNTKFGTAYLQKFLVRNAKFLILRDKYSYELTKSILQQDKEKFEEIAEYDGDFTYYLLKEAKSIFSENNIESNRDSYYLINISPLCDINKSFRIIKEFSNSHKEMQPIYIACNKSEDLRFYDDILQILPNCEIFDWTQSETSEILKLFYFAKSGIGARLHFLYIFKFFKKNFIQLHSSHKIQSNLSDLDS